MTAWKMNSFGKMSRQTLIDYLHGAEITYVTVASYGTKSDPRHLEKDWNFDELFDLLEPGGFIKMDLGVTIDNGNDIPSMHYLENASSVAV